MELENSSPSAPDSGTPPETRRSTDSDLSRLIRERRETSEVRNFADALKLRLEANEAAFGPVDPELMARHEKRIQESIQAERDRDVKFRWDAFVPKIGVRYANCSVKDYVIYDDAQRRVVERLKQYGRNLRENVAACRGIILYGPPGAGKDHLLIALAKYAICHHEMTVDYVTGAELFMTIRDQMDDDNAKESTYIRKLLAPSILIVSDPVPPEDSLKGFRREKLGHIVDRRYRDNKPTWITANVASGKEAEERMGPALVSRLREQALSEWCDWPDYRSRR